MFEYFNILHIDDLKSQIEQIHLIKWEHINDIVKFWAMAKSGSETHLKLYIQYESYIGFVFLNHK